MNWFKWLICWWHKTHVFSSFIDKEGNNVSICVRCGCVRRAVQGTIKKNEENENGYR
jgi:hypothetical protein